MRRAAKVDRTSTFGMWTILSPEYGKTAGHKVLCLARCQCGKEAIRHLQSITSGTSKSCGCARAGRGNGRFKHGHEGSPEYIAWKAMNARCHNPNASNFKWYGAKGVSVCDRWRTDFSAFLSDLGPKPSSIHSVDRIDPFKGYSPENCRWATQAEQMKNQRRHHAAG